MVSVQIDGARTLTRTQLVRVGEGVVQNLHHWDHAGRLVFDPFDGRTRLTQVRERQGDPAPTLRQLKRRVDAPSNRFHVVFHAQQEAGDQFTASLLPRVQERGGRRLETAAQHLINQVFRHLKVALP